MRYQAKEIVMILVLDYMIQELGDGFQETRMKVNIHHLHRIIIQKIILSILKIMKVKMRHIQ